MHQPQPPAVAAARHCVHVGLTLHGSDGGANSVILSDGLANFGNAGDDATFFVAATAGRLEGRWNLHLWKSFGRPSARRRWAPEKTDGLKRLMRAAKRAASSVWAAGLCSMAAAGGGDGAGHTDWMIDSTSLSTDVQSPTGRSSTALPFDRTRCP